MNTCRLTWCSLQFIIRWPFDLAPPFRRCISTSFFWQEAWSRVLLWFVYECAGPRVCLWEQGKPDSAAYSVWKWAWSELSVKMDREISVAGGWGVSQGGKLWASYYSMQIFHDAILKMSWGMCLVSRQKWILSSFLFQSKYCTLALVCVTCGKPWVAGIHFFFFLFLNESGSFVLSSLIYVDYCHLFEGSPLMRKGTRLSTFFYVIYRSGVAILMFSHIFVFFVFIKYKTFPCSCFYKMDGSDFR